MRGHTDSPTLRVLNTYLELTIGSPRSPEAWSLDRALRLASVAPFRWIEESLERIVPTVAETDARLGPACVYTSSLGPELDLVCYFSTCAPWSALALWSASAMEDSAPRRALRDTRFLGFQTATDVADDARSVTAMVDSLGFHIASEAECRALTPYSTRGGERLTYFELLFQSDTLDFPWERSG
jgi:hypothetical protein